MRYQDAFDPGPRYTRHASAQRPPWDLEDYDDFPSHSYQSSDFPTGVDQIPVQDGIPAPRPVTLDGRRYGVTGPEEDAPSARRRGWRLLAGAVSGVLAVATGLGVANLAAAYLRPQASSITAVGAAILGRAPTALDNFTIDKFGGNYKTVLVASLCVAIALLAMVIGMIGWRYLPVGIVGIALLGALEAYVVYTRLGSQVTNVIPSLAGVVAGIAAFVVLKGLTRVRQHSHARAGVVNGAGGTGRSGLLA
jgi:hypothetical protein